MNRQHDQCDNCKQLVAANRHIDRQTEAYYHNLLSCHKSAKWLLAHPGAEPASEAPATPVESAPIPYSSSNLRRSRRARSRTDAQSGLNASMSDQMAPVDLTSVLNSTTSVQHNSASQQTRRTVQNNPTPLPSTVASQSTAASSVPHRRFRFEPIDVVQLPGFPFLDGSDMDRLTEYELCQMAFAEYVLSELSSRTNNRFVASSSSYDVQWIIERLHIDDKQLGVFRKTITRDRARVTKCIKQVRDELGLDESLLLSDELFWRDLRAVCHDTNLASPRLVLPDQCIAKTSYVSGLERKLSKLQEEVSRLEKESTIIDLKKAIALFKKESHGNFNIGRLFVMNELRAVALNVGNDKLSEIVMLVVLMTLYTLTQKDGETSPSDVLLIAETAAFLTPSSQMWSNVPLVFDPLQTDRVRKKLADMQQVFLMNDHGHSAGNALRRI